MNEFNRKIKILIQFTIAAPIPTLTAK